ncbi:MAG: hypothetical protein HZB73_05665, partial [Nitrosarchaeum sp.]|nr:hypothetical protein [Nitrosarchaeum sp.]
IAFTQNVISIVDDNNQYFLVLLVPLSGYILLRTESRRINFINTRLVSSSILTIILISSVALTPFSIGSNYWGTAYAEEFSFSGIIKDANNNLKSNTVTTEPINSTSTEPINSTSTEPINSTSIESSESVITSKTNLLAQFNKTELENQTNSTQNTESISSLDLNGEDGFVIMTNQTSTDTLQELTVSSWVKPDYSKGSQEFTVISKDNSFILSINNKITPTKIAKFSVFDGAKWTSVESTTTIDEKWTQLSATFNGTSIEIYVNGQLESTNTLEEQLTLSVNGNLATTTIDSLSSEADIVIGASVDVRKGSEQISRQFSGQINDVSLFDSQLNNVQIKSLYDEKSEYYMSQNSVEINLDTILAEIITEQSINATSTDLVNITSTESTKIIDTELIVNATLDSVKETYLITENAELSLEFYNEHDVLTNEIKELENSLLLLSKLEQELEQEPIIANTTVAEPTNATTLKPIILNFIGMLFTIPHADATTPTIDDQSKIDIANIKEQILLLKEKINAIKANGKTNEQDIKEAKLQLESILTELKQNANSISQNNDNVTQKIQNSTDNIEKIGDIEPENIIQENMWIGNNEQITTKVYDSDGNLVDIKYQYEKIRDGKFKLDLAFDSSDNVKPGLYKVKTTLLVDGQTHVIESEFAWGLVSLNTKKSIYKPGEIAEFVIVVLDSQGHPVCDANLSMGITDPNSIVTTLTSGNEISADTECGLYNTSFVTGSEGTYNISIRAKASEIDTSFGTTFDVLSSYSYDIIRTAQSKIDPVTNTNEFPVRLDIESFVNVNGPIVVKETVPITFEVTTDADITIVNNTKILTWTKELVNNKTYVEYTYSVPLIFPQLYSLGKVDIYNNDLLLFTEARNWYVAADPPYNSIQIGTVSTYASAATATTHTLSYTPSAGNDRVLVVALHVRSGTAPPNGVTYGGTPMTLAVGLPTGTSSRADIYYLINPANGPYWSTLLGCHYYCKQSSCRCCIS